MNDRHHPQLREPMEAIPAQDKPARFSRSLLISAGLAVLLAVAFALYVSSRERVADAYKLRHRSFLLADELRQSGDDLTRMVRTYVTTGDPVFKQHFQDILDIRDGKKPRPENYWRPYWDLMPSGGPVPRPDSEQAVPLLELMRQAGFTEEEFGKLAEAEANSNALSAPEIEAMKVVGSGGVVAEADRARALGMLFDEKYRQAKRSVMQPIHDFLVLVDQRTLASVEAAKTRATVLREVFVAIAMGLMCMLWRTHSALRSTLGGPLEEVHAQIARIGSGDFSSAIRLDASAKNSVLGWLAETQAKLNEGARAQKQAAEATRLSEERLRLAIDGARLGTWHWDIRTGALECSEACLAIFGIPPGTVMTYERFLAALHPDDRARTDAALRQALDDRFDFDIEYRAVWPDGSEHWISAKGRGYYDAGGEPTRMEGVVLDITERKESERALRESEEFNRRIIASSLDCIKVLDLDGKLLSMSEGGQRQLEIQDIGRYLGGCWVSFWQAEDQPRVREAVDAACAGGMGRFQAFCPTEAGNPRWWDVIITPIFGADGRVRRLLAVSRDITERQRAEEDLLRAHNTLEQRVQERTAELMAANKEIEAFSYSVSHDLRAPLRAIDGFARILSAEHRSGLQPEAVDCLDEIIGGARQMGALIDDLLAFSRVGKQALQPRGVDLAAMVRECLKTLASEQKGRNVEIVIGELGSCEADPALLRQVWMNLLANALKYTRQRADARIELGCREEDGARVYSIRDNGVGFDMKYVGKLFGVFQRLHRAEDFEGTGIGLATVQRIIHRHGGRVWAQGARNEGATFFFTVGSATPGHNHSARDGFEPAAMAPTGETL